MKYKPCCDIRCLLNDCKTKQQGACYCLCELFDHISTVQDAINGDAIYYKSGIVRRGGTQEYIKELYDNLTEEAKDLIEHLKN